ncbi:ABC transporter ATP-binding protein [Granulicella cerasi]|uniref:ABC transporter ATP-binding protein n=1 Tax=Granulicella cerasi TaxID=741063 RepID=A0ABW1ZAJ3_9BACT|nr:oligopeptide/dipeptide ABC transporter ATP-binding protein [Granulicella cerasi]
MTESQAVQPLLEVTSLRKYFPTSKGLFSRSAPVVKAVDDVSFQVNAGEIVGLVGESGSGKTTIGRSVLRLLEPTSGSVRFDGKELTSLNEAEMRAMRKDMQIVFQDPFASLNPRMTAEQILTQALKIHGLAEGNARDTVVSLLERVGLSATHLTRFPHEFSGGQRQRIGIARAISLRPRFLVADEPVSALDVSVQAQVVNLLQGLQREMNLAMLFVAHDLSVVEYISDRVIVLYLGRIMEVGRGRDLYTNPHHPYTEALLSAVPVPDPTVQRKRVFLEGDIPSPLNPPSGCVFRTRCPIATEVCAREVPPLVEIAPAHFKACHHR